MGVYRRQDKAAYRYRFRHRGRAYEQGGFPSARRAQEAEWRRRGEVGALGPRRRGQAPLEDPTLKEYAARWLAAIEPALAPTTLRSYAERLRGHALPALGGTRVRDLGPAQLRAWLDAKRQEGHAPNSLRLMRAALSALLSDAAADGLIPTNPLLGQGRRRRQARPAAPEPLHPLSQADRDRVLGAAQQTSGINPYGLLFELLAKTGLRPSEAYALRPGDLDRTGHRLRVERAWLLGRLAPTKTRQPRWVDVPAGLWGRLAPRAGAWLFQNRQGTPLDHSRVARAFRRAARAAGCPQARLYDLRHTYASLRLAAGAPLTYVAAQLGHATATTTLRFYARWIPTAGQQWVEQDRREPGVTGGVDGTGAVG